MIEKLENLQTSYYVDLGNGSYTWRNMSVGDIAKKVDELVNKTNEIIDYLNDTSKTTKRTYMSTKTGAIIDD